MIAQILLATALVLTPINDKDKYVYSSPNNYATIVVPDEAKCPQWWPMAISVGWSATNMEKLDKKQISVDQAKAMASLAKQANNVLTTQLDAGKFIANIKDAKIHLNEVGL